MNQSPWRNWAPAWLQAAASPPLMVTDDVVGRVELVVGRLGAGKTTYGALRAKRLARDTGRELVTTGAGWPEPWRCVADWDTLESLRDCVVLIDEVHLIAPSSRGLLTPDVERRLIRWLSLCRKRRICVISTTQAWTRVATHYRQLVTTVWVCEPIKPGRLHRATAHESPDEGGREVWSPQYYKPSDASIPTEAEAWVPYVIDEQADGRAQARPPAASSPRRASR